MNDSTEVRQGESQKTRPQLKNVRRSLPRTLKPQTAVMTEFWLRQLNGSRENSNNATTTERITPESSEKTLKQKLGLTIPMKPVKRLMKSDDQITQKVSRDANAVMTVLLELFLKDLATRSAYHMVQSRRVCMTSADVAAAAVDTDSFDFLIDVLPSRELDTARIAAQEQCERAREDEDILYLALARQRRRTDSANVSSSQNPSRSLHQHDDAAQERLNSFTSPAQILQQQHLQTLMSLSAQMGTSSVPVAHEYAAVAAAMASMVLPSFNSQLQENHQLVPQPQQRSQQAVQSYISVRNAPRILSGSLVSGGGGTTIVQPSGTTNGPTMEGQDMLPFFTFQPADAGVEGLSTVAIAHEAAEAENMDGAMSVAPGVHTGAFPTLWMQNPQPQEREELDDQNEDDDDDYDDEDYEEEEQDLYDPDEEEDYDDDENDDDEATHDDTMEGRRGHNS